MLRVAQGQLSKFAKKKEQISEIDRQQPTRQNFCEKVAKMSTAEFQVHWVSIVRFRLVRCNRSGMSDAMPSLCFRGLLSDAFNV